MKKSKVDVGKGFKRIYFVLAAVWVAFVFILWFADFMACQVHKSDDFAQCWDYNAGGQFLLFVIMAGLVVPLYYFLVWIVQGFKK